MFWVTVAGHWASHSLIDITVRAWSLPEKWQWNVKVNLKVGFKRETNLFLAPMLGWGFSVEEWLSYDSVLPADPGRWTRQGLGLTCELRIKVKINHYKISLNKFNENKYLFLNDLLLWSPESKYSSVSVLESRSKLVSRLSLWDISSHWVPQNYTTKVHKQAM